MAVKATYTSNVQIDANAVVNEVLNGLIKGSSLSKGDAKKVQEQFGALVSTGLSKGAAEGSVEVINRIVEVAQNIKRIRDNSLGDIDATFDFTNVLKSLTKAGSTFEDVLTTFTNIERRYQNIMSAIEIGPGGKELRTALGSIAPKDQAKYLDQLQKIRTEQDGQAARTKKFRDEFTGAWDSIEQVVDKKGQRVKASVADIYSNMFRNQLVKGAGLTKTAVEERAISAPDMAKQLGITSNITKRTKGYQDLKSYSEISVVVNEQQRAQEEQYNIMHDTSSSLKKRGAAGKNVATLSSYLKSTVEYARTIQDQIEKQFDIKIDPKSVAAPLSGDIAQIRERYANEYRDMFDTRSAEQTQQLNALIDEIFTAATSAADAARERSSQNVEKGRKKRAASQVKDGGGGNGTQTVIHDGVVSSGGSGDGSGSGSGSGQGGGQGGDGTGDGTGNGGSNKDKSLEGIDSEVITGLNENLTTLNQSIPTLQTSINGLSEKLDKVQVVGQGGGTPSQTSDSASAPAPSSAPPVPTPPPADKESEAPTQPEQQIEASAKAAQESADKVQQSAQNAENVIKQGVDLVKEQMALMVVASGVKQDHAQAWGSQGQRYNLNNKTAGINSAKQGQYAQGTGIYASQRIPELKKGEHLYAVDQKNLQQLEIASKEAQDAIIRFGTALDKWVYQNNKGWTKSLNPVTREPWDKALYDMDWDAIYQEAQKAFGEQFKQTIDEFKQVLEPIIGLVKRSDIAGSGTQYWSWGNDTPLTALIRAMGYQGVHASHAGAKTQEYSTVQFDTPSDLSKQGALSEAKIKDGAVLLQEIKEKGKKAKQQIDETAKSVEHLQAVASGTVVSSDAKPKQTAVATTTSDQKEITSPAASEGEGDIPALQRSIETDVKSLVNNGIAIKKITSAQSSTDEQTDDAKSSTDKEKVTEEKPEQSKDYSALQTALETAFERFALKLNETKTEESSKDTTSEQTELQNILVQQREVSKSQGVDIDSEQNTQNGVEQIRTTVLNIMQALASGTADPSKVLAASTASGRTYPVESVKNGEVKEATDTIVRTVLDRAATLFRTDMRPKDILETPSTSFLKSYNPVANLTNFGSLKGNERQGHINQLQIAEDEVLQANLQQLIPKITALAEKAGIDFTEMLSRMYTEVGNGAQHEFNWLKHMKGFFLPSQEELTYFQRNKKEDNRDINFVQQALEHTLPYNLTGQLNDMRYLPLLEEFRAKFVSQWMDRFFAEIGTDKTIPEKFKQDQELYFKQYAENLFPQDRMLPHWQPYEYWERFKTVMSKSAANGDYYIQPAARRKEKIGLYTSEADASNGSAIITDVRAILEKALTETVNPIQKLSEILHISAETFADDVKLWNVAWRTAEEQKQRQYGIDEFSVRYMSPEQFKANYSPAVSEEHGGIAGIVSIQRTIQTTQERIENKLQQGVKIDASANANAPKAVTGFEGYKQLDDSIVNNEVIKFGKIEEAVRGVVKALHDKIVEVQVEESQVGRSVKNELVYFEDLIRKLGSIKYNINLISDKKYPIILELSPSPDEIINRLNGQRQGIEQIVTNKEGASTLILTIVEGLDKAFGEIESKISTFISKQETVIINWFKKLVSELKTIASQAQIYEAQMTAVNNPAADVGKEGGLTARVRNSLDGLRKEIQQYYADNPIKIKFVFPFLKKDGLQFSKEIRDYFTAHPIIVQVSPKIANNFRSSLLQQIKDAMGAGVDVTVRADTKLIKDTTATKKTAKSNVDPLTGQTYGQMVPLRTDKQNGFWYTKDNEFRAEKTLDGKAYLLSRRNAAMGESYYETVDLIEGQLNNVRAAIVQITRNEEKIAVETAKATQQAAAATETATQQATTALTEVQTANVAEAQAATNVATSAQAVTEASQQAQTAAKVSSSASQEVAETSEEQMTQAEMADAAVREAMAQERARMASLGIVPSVGDISHTGNKATASFAFKGRDEYGRAYMGSRIISRKVYEDEEGVHVAGFESDKDQINYLRGKKSSSAVLHEIEIAEQELKKLQEEYRKAGKEFDLVEEENFQKWTVRIQERIHGEEEAAAAKKAANKDAATEEARLQREALRNQEEAARIARDAITPEQFVGYQGKVTDLRTNVLQQQSTAEKYNVGQEEGAKGYTAINQLKELLTLLDSINLAQEKGTTTTNGFNAAFKDQQTIYNTQKAALKTPLIESKQWEGEVQNVQKALKSANQLMGSWSQKSFMPDYRAEFEKQQTEYTKLFPNGIFQPRTDGKEGFSSEVIRPTPESIQSWQDLIGQITKFRDLQKTVGQDKAFEAQKDQVDSLRLRIQKILAENSRMSAGMQRSFTDIQARLNSGTQLSAEDLRKLRSEVTSLNAELYRTGQTGLSFIDRFRNKMRQLAAYFSSIFSIYRVIGIIRQGISYIKQFDTALTEMAKVSDQTLGALRRFQKQSFDQAASVGTTAVQIQNSTADFMRLGESLEQAARSAVTANKLQAVSEFSSISDATEALTSMSQAYKEQDKEAIVDVVNEIGNNYAISTQGVATALQASASALRTAQNDLYESAALVTAGNQVVQDPNKVGTGVRTIALRITGTSAAKKEQEEQGENVDDFVMTTSSKMAEKIRGLTQVITEDGEKMSVSILDANGNYRSTYEILLDIAKIWDQIGKEDKLTGENRQNALLELLGGKIRANIVASILESPDVLERAYYSALNSQGSAENEQNKYLDSIEGHINQVQTRWQELWDSDNYRGVITFVLKVAEGLLKISKNLGLIGTTIGGLGIATAVSGVRSMFGKGFVYNIQQSMLGLRDTFNGQDTASLQSIVSLYQQGGLHSDDLTETLGKMTAGFANLTRGQRQYIIDTRVANANMGESAEVAKNLLYRQVGLSYSTKVLGESQRDAATYTEAFNQTLASQKQTIIQFAVIAGVTLAIGLVVKAIKNARERVEEIKKSAASLTTTLKEFQSTANDNQSTISSLNKRFTQQSKGVNDLGQNIAQSDNEYQEYLETCKQIASIAPNLVTYYNDQGKAIIRLKDGVEDLNQAYKESLANDAANFLINGSDEGTKVSDIRENYFNNNSEFNEQRLEFFNKLSEIDTAVGFTAYTNELYERMMEDADGLEGRQLLSLQDTLYKAGETAWSPVATAYNSSKVDFAVIRQIVTAARSAFIQAQNESDAQVATVLRNSLMMQINTLSPEVYQLSSSIIESLSSGAIESIMNEDRLLSFMPLLAGRLSQQSKDSKQFGLFQKALTFAALSPDIPASEQGELQQQYQSVLSSVFDGLLSNDVLTQMFGLDASKRFEQNVSEAIERMSKDVDVGPLPMPGEDIVAQRALAARIEQEFENLGIDTQNELAAFLYAWNNTWDATKQNWSEQIDSFLNRLVETSEFDWSAQKETIDEIQSEISNLSTMSRNLFTNQRTPEVMIDSLQVIAESGIDLDEYKTVGDAFLAYQDSLWDKYEERLNDMDAPQEQKDQIRALFSGATNLDVFDQVGELEKSLNTIQSTYDTVIGAMEEYNKLGFLTMNTIDSLVALDDSYINAQIDENGVLQYNAEAFKQVALARIDEAKAAVWKEANTRLEEIAMMDSAYAANELAKANGTLSDSAYAAAKASYYKAAAISSEHRLLANQTMEAAQKRVALFDYQLEQVRNDTYSFGGASSSAASSAESSYGELFDFFERRVKVLQNALDQLEKNSENLEGSFAKNNQLEQNTAIVLEELNNYEDALGMYSTAAGFYFDQLDDEMKEKILHGAIDLHALIGENGEAVNDQLSSYVEWEDKAQDCRIKLAELRKELAQLELTKFQNIMEDFSNNFDIFQNGIDLIDSQVGVYEEAGQLVGKAFFEEQRNETVAQYNLLNEEVTRLQEQMQKALASGYVEEGSEEWLEMSNSIAETQKNALEAAKSIETLNNSIRDVDWNTFQRVQDDYANLSEELEHLGDLLNDATDIEVSNGYMEFNEEATALLGTYAQRYEIAKEQVFQYQDAIEQLNQEYKQGLWSETEYNEKLWELKEGQWAAVESCESLEDAIMDLNEQAVNEAIERINDEIEAYQELTDAQLETLEAEKDLHDWQKRLAESNKTIADLERQLAAMANDNTASTVAKRKQLEEQLAEARDELEEEEYQHSIETQQDAQNKQMEDYQKAREDEIEQLEESLKDREGYITRSFETVRNSASTVVNQIVQTAMNAGVTIANIATQNGMLMAQNASEQGYIISQSIVSAWAAGSAAIDGYSATLTQSTSAWTGQLQGVQQTETNQQNTANNLANTTVNAMNNSAQSVWRLSEALQNSWRDANNVNEMFKAIADSSFKALERGFNADAVTSALRAIEAAAKSASDAIANMSGPKIGTGGNTVVVAGGGGGRQKVIMARAKGGLISKGDGGSFDALAQAVGEDTIVAAKYGESVLTPLQTDAMIKMAPFLETIAHQLPDFGRSGRIALPGIGSSSSNRSVQIGSLVTINGNVDDNNLRQIQQTIQAELRKSFNKINLDFKYA